MLYSVIMNNIPGMYGNIQKSWLIKKKRKNKKCRKTCIQLKITQFSYIMTNIIDLPLIFIIAILYQIMPDEL